MSITDPLPIEHVEQQHVYYTSESRLHRKRLFLMTAMSDLLNSKPTAIRFFLRGLSQKYRFSSLGIVWAFVPAIITAIVLIGSQKANLVDHSRGAVPPAFYGVFGLALAQTFLDGLNATRMVFSSNQFLLRRSNVPIEGLIGAGILDSAFGVLVRAVIIVAAYLFFGVHPVRSVLLSVSGVVGTLMIGCGIGLWLAPFSSLKRDIDNIMGFLPWILFAITPIFVKPGPGSIALTVYLFNPLAWIFDSTRTLAYGAPGSGWPAVLSLFLGLLVLLSGWLSCRMWRPYVIERSLV